MLNNTYDAFGFPLARAPLLSTGPIDSRIYCQILLMRLRNNIFLRPGTTDLFFIAPELSRVAKCPYPLTIPSAFLQMISSSTTWNVLTNLFSLNH